MDKVVADGRQFAAMAELNISDMSAQAPVGTTLAILERVMKVMSAVQARIHYTMKEEFKLLAAIIRDNTPESYDYQPEVGDAGAKRSDYDCCDVLPVSDPNASTMAQRVVQYQAVMQLAQQAPQIYDLPYLHRQMIEVLGVKNAQKIVPLKDDMLPMDPVSENMAIMVGKPVKAFLYQDHQAHIATHTAAMHDPKLMQIVGQNPQAQAIMAAGMAHLMEHVAMEYRREIEQNLGSTLPPPPQAALAGAEGDDNTTGYMSPQLEVQISQLEALAAQKLFQNNQQQQQQMQAQQQAQDPLIQIQQQDLQLRQQELQMKQQQMQMEQQIKQLQLQLQQQEIERKKEKDLMDAEAKAEDLKARQQMEGVKLGATLTHQGHQRELEKSQHLVEAHKIGANIQHEGHRQRQMKAQSGIDMLKHAATLEHQASENDADRKAQQAQEQVSDGEEEGNE